MATRNKTWIPQFFVRIIWSEVVEWLRFSQFVLTCNPRHAQFIQIGALHCSCDFARISGAKFILVGWTAYASACVQLKMWGIRQCVAIDTITFYQYSQSFHIVQSRWREVTGTSKIWYGAVDGKNISAFVVSPITEAVLWECCITIGIRAEIAYKAIRGFVKIVTLRSITTPTRPIVAIAWSHS